MATRLDISIGPVQGFVAQSRRTRDLWSSSYLLSFLSAHAMHGAQAAGGTVIQPRIAGDPLYRWVSGQQQGNPPQLGSVPNHFVLEVGGTPSTVAAAARERFNAAWSRVCDAVWNEYVEPVAGFGNGTEEIWRRQVNGFWEFVWTAGPFEAREGLLARRKHWRSLQSSEETGDKCTLTHDFQEISGYIRAQGGSERASQDAFWQQMRSKKHLGRLDLRENERLSAIGLVKRLFPLVSQQAIGWRVDRSHWPSTMEMAARDDGKRGDENTPDQLTPFYAVLLADGDRLGRMVGELGGDQVGKALSHFTADVPNIVQHRDPEEAGVTIYAGGDDVLAMLPVEGALDCAQALADRYHAAFEGETGATLSAAVVFAQARVPLRSVIDEAHRLLDGVAKEGNGRDSLAAGVLKGSGRHCQWVSSWTRKLPDGSEAPALDVLADLTRRVGDLSSEPGISGSLTYRMRDTLARLCGWERWQPGDWGTLPPGVDIRSILRAEIDRSLEATGSGSESDVWPLADTLWRMLGPSRSGDGTNSAGTVEVGIDGLMLARFLADPTSEE